MTFKDRGRDNLIGSAVQMVVWVAERRRPFTITEFGEAHEMCRRSAYRWLNALEASGMVERCGTRKGVRKRANVTLWHGLERAREVAA